MADETWASLHHLVQACRMGDDTAWRQLLERISRLVFVICAEHSLTQEESLDIFGQVSYLLVSSIDQIKEPSKIVSYAGTVTRRQIYNRYRKDRGIDFVDSAVIDDAPAEMGSRPDVQFETARHREQLVEALSELPERDYRLLSLLFFDERGPDYQEIAGLLNMPVSSIGPTRARALKKLEQILKQKKFDFDVF